MELLYVGVFIVGTIGGTAAVLLGVFKLFGVRL